jgi:hypothetical protein
VSSGSTPTSAGCRPDGRPRRRRTPPDGVRDLGQRLVELGADLLAHAQERDGRTIEPVVIDPGAPEPPKTFADLFTTNPKAPLTVILLVSIPVLIGFFAGYVSCFCHR